MKNQEENASAFQSVFEAKDLIYAYRYRLALGGVLMIISPACRSGFAAVVELSG
jgi:hypothetical protein